MNLRPEKIKKKRVTETFGDSRRAVRLKKYSCNLYKFLGQRKPRRGEEFWRELSRGSRQHSPERGQEEMEDSD